MDFVSPIVDITDRLCSCIGNTTNYIRHLQDNLNSLRSEKQKLIEHRNDVQREVESCETQHMQRKERVDSWLRRVGELEGEVDQILRQGDEEINRRCLKFCPRNCRSSHKLGKKVCKKLQAVADLKGEGNFTTVALPSSPAHAQVAVPLAPAHAQQIPVDRTLGLDSTFHKVLALLRDDDDDGMGIIGIYGMGGIGKTTLLKKLNNELASDQLSGRKLDEVIWVVVSKDLSSVESVQDKIGKKLGFPEDKWQNKSQDEKQADIFEFLKMKKFVLLLDDVWGRIDLLEVGVPPPSNQNKAKIAFTTRSEEVCSLMEAKKSIKVECLAWQEGWDLFKDKVGEQILNSDPEIEKLARVVCKECAGLPLALITIGRAMASKKTPQEWNHAISVLKKSSTFKIRGMEDDVLRRLKFSYDSLSDETIQICFLYCALYPEDWDIDVEDLINFWIGEGFLDDECDNIDEAFKLAYDVIGRLKLACLLLDSRESYKCVNMHDVIRDMALWIISENGKKNEKYLVQGGNREPTTAPPISKWEKAERIFLSSNSIKELSGSTPRCPNLLTLNLSDNSMTTIPASFFQFMPALKVLDLSWNVNLKKLPASFFGLLSLQHLDLSGTGITQLPTEFKSLKKLKYLYLNRMSELVTIAPQVISSLSILQRLEIRDSGVSSKEICEGSILFGGNELLSDEVECLKDLQYLSLTVKSKLALQKLLSSEKLRSCTFDLCIREYRDSSALQLSSLQKNLKRLEKLQIVECDDLELELSMRWEEGERGAVPPHRYNNNNPWDHRIIDAAGSRSFQNLREVTIRRCKVLKDLTWLISAPNLQQLSIYRCDAMEKVIKDAENCSSSDDIAGREGSLSVFSRLQRLTLWCLPELKSVYNHPLPFPSLIEVIVADCPKLKKLPFDSNSGKGTLRSIECNREWWNKLEWENEETQSVFSPLFKEP
ncbi:probable disease resistance protein At5g63020 [Cornus florida]|uniref:probable disease resistance protein At5g63020 n=1 Tax=Cornus florida TaxID=4283 RepID=UPI002896B520|nr:probable disease resistance protein At5g63020 [Cornus florida]